MTSTLIILPPVPSSNTGTICRSIPTSSIRARSRCGRRRRRRRIGVGSVTAGAADLVGTSPHHLAYPGTISLRMATMSDVLVDICPSLAGHGFYRILFLNGHGGNVGVLTATALRISEEIGITPAVVSYWTLIKERCASSANSANGGMGHACEMETSMQLHFRATAWRWIRRRRSRAIRSPAIPASTSATPVR